MTAGEIRAFLSEPVSLHGISCRNRIIRSATNDYRGSRDGKVTDEQLQIYKELADGGAGLLITGNFYISEDGRLDETQLSLCSPDAVSGLRALTGLVHAKGCAIVAQISHAGSKAKINPAAALHYRSPATLSKSEIRQIVEDFARAASLAKKCGFDGVQVHCAHGYLISDFLDPVINDRSDEYGGNAVGMIRFPLEIIEQIRALCGPDYPLIIKLASTIEPNLKWNSAAYTRLFQQYLGIFQGAGVQAVEISGWNLSAYKQADHNYFQDSLAAACEVVSVPLILTGGLRSLADIGSAFSSGADYVGFSRPFIRAPDFTKALILHGEASACVSCNRCYRLKEPGGQRCAFL